MVKMTAKALVAIKAEPARAHAVDLVMIGQLLAGRLVRDGICKWRGPSERHTAASFAQIWRDEVVPVAAASMTEWKVGMCAEIHGLTSAKGKVWNNSVGRVISRNNDDGERFEVAVRLELTPPRAPNALLTSPA